MLTGLQSGSMIARTSMMHNRLQAAIDSDSGTQGLLGSLAYMQPELLQVILMHLGISNLGHVEEING